MNILDFGAIISVAFLGSLGHCTGMCGGFVVAYSSAKVSHILSPYHRFIAHLFYNMGRISSYVFLGMGVGLVGSLFTFSRHISGYFHFAIGIVMVLMGLSLMGKIKFLTEMEFSIASKPFFKSIFSKLIHSKKYSSFYGLGVLNGFVPCGFVYFFLATAAASKSLLEGGFVMLIFGLSTMPVLLGLGFFTEMIHKNNFRGVLNKIASVIIIAYGIHMAYKGYFSIIS